MSQFWIQVVVVGTLMLLKNNAADKRLQTLCDKFMNISIENIVFIIVFVVRIIELFLYCKGGT